MSAVKFNDLDVEHYVLASMLRGPEYWKNVPEAWFYEPQNLVAYKAFKSFLHAPYNTYPTPELIIDKVEDLNIKLLAKELGKIKIDLPTQNVKLYDMYEMYAARKVYDLVQAIPNDMEKMRMEEVIRSRITEFSELVNPFEAGRRERGFIYEGAKARWQRYREVESDPSIRHVVPTHISGLDKAVNGGLRNSWIILLYARSGGFKTLAKANIAYNMAFLDKRDVMVMSLEVSKPDYELIVDSRNAMLDMDQIVAGSLGQERSKYRQSLIQLDSDKPPLYIVDIPDRATSVDLISEQELYYAKFGKYSDVLVLDYINEMDPETPWGNTGEKFKNLGVEIRRITRSYDFIFMGSMQENREGAKLLDRSKADTEHIGESHQFQNVCHVIIHLYRDSEGVDEATNQLHWSIKKNRFGEKSNFVTFANPVVKYIGDRRFVVS